MKNNLIMKKILYQNISNDFFSKELFEKIITENPQSIIKEPSLIFKSLVENNIEAFSWLTEKIYWIPYYESIVYEMIKMDSFLPFYRILEKQNQKFIQGDCQVQIFFKQAIKNYSWIRNNKNKSEREIILKEIFNTNFIEKDPLKLDELLRHKELHPFIFSSFKNGTLPYHKNEFFAEYCKNGSPQKINHFKDIGCDFHYLNDLALKNAANYRNEEMFIHLIKLEGLNPFLSDGFALKTLITEDEIEESNISNDTIFFIAELVNESKSPSKSLLKVLNSNKIFVAALNKFKIEKSLKNHIQHNKPNKIKKV